MTEKAPAVSNDLRGQIAKLPGSEGWWKSDGQDTFERLARDLIAHGFTEAETVALLSEAYFTAAEEYGS